MYISSHVTNSQVAGVKLYSNDVNILALFNYCTIILIKKNTPCAYLCFFFFKLMVILYFTDFPLKGSVQWKGET